MPGQSAGSAKLKLVGYVRASSPIKVEEGRGLAIQEQAIRRWAKEQGHRLVGVHRDEGVSGLAEERSGLTEALVAIRYNGAQGLVVHYLDRLARSFTVQEAVLAQVWSAGGRVFTVDGGEVLADDPDDPMRTFVRQVVGAVGQLDRSMIALRLRRGRQRKAQDGGYSGGAPPLGYRAEGGELVPDPDEQRTVQLIIQLRNEGASLRNIAVTLTAEGLEPKRGGRWHPMMVKRVVDRAGAGQAGRRRTPQLLDVERVEVPAGG
jgi:DNA invertase Pin-like site-specific DNA recombinase